MHSYTAVTDSERGAGDDEEPPARAPTMATSTRLRNLVSPTAVLMLISGIAGALVLSAVQSYHATASTITSTHEMERLHDLLSGKPGVLRIGTAQMRLQISG